MGWFLACGDETCDTCGRVAHENMQLHYSSETDKTRCEVCVDNEEDLIVGQCLNMDDWREGV